jgi:Protein of unknown function (DUF3455)
MRLVKVSLVTLAAAAVAFWSATASPRVSASACNEDFPAALRAPAGNALAFGLQADGVQIYDCSETHGVFAWTFRAPEAKLVGPAGEPAGKHYAGPTWEATDGSKVVGVKVDGATPDPAAIPWLLLRAASHAGSGRMGDVTFVQRLQTSGGNAPPLACDAAHQGSVARVPYQAAYCFYRAEPRN